MIKVNRIIQGECLEELKKLPEKCVDMSMSSPPYWALRDYGTANWEGGDKDCSHRRDSKWSEKCNTGHIRKDLTVGDAIYKDICKKCGAKRVDKQLGLEPTFDEYINKLCDIYDEVKRVLKDNGTCWVNLGDSYYSVSGGKFLNDNISSTEKNIKNRSFKW